MKTKGCYRRLLIILNLAFLLTFFLGLKIASAQEINATIESVVVRGNEIEAPILIKNLSNRPVSCPIVPADLIFTPNLPMTSLCGFGIAFFARSNTADSTLQIEESDLPLGDSVPSVKLAALKSATAVGKVKIPLDFPIGTYRLVALVGFGELQDQQVILSETTFTISGSANAGPNCAFPSIVRQIKAGGQAITDSNQCNWIAEGDRVLGGHKQNTGFNIPGIAKRDQPIFTTYRSGPRFAYYLPYFQPGNYIVQLFFIEPFFSEAGKRVFDVSAQGNIVLSDFDIIANHGGKEPIAERFIVQVGDDGMINLGFDGVVGDALVSGIVVMQE